IENVAEGEFLLTGSLKDMVITPPQHAKLQFHEGRMIALTGDTPVTTALDRLLDHGREKGDANANCLAELGIGLNLSGVLTGNPLYDEKCGGTAHIALGDNDRYGG